MQKCKKTINAKKKGKAAIATVLAATLAVPTVAHFSSKPSMAEEQAKAPKALTTITFEKGFVGEKSLHGLNVVKSEQVLVFKELKTGENGKDYIYDGKSKVYDMTDKPVIESSVYKYASIGNQPSTAYDDKLGSVLVFDDTVEVKQFAKKEVDEYTDIELGTVIQEATIAHSQVQMNNPFAGKTLTNGASVSYWVKPVTDEADQTKGANSTLIVFSAKDEDNKKAEVDRKVEKQQEVEADGSLSVQISANNDFHYVVSSEGVSVAYEGDGSVLAKPNQWSYVTVTMTDEKIVTYVNGVEVSNKEVTATGLTKALADSNTGVFFGGNYSQAAELVGQNFGTVRNTCLDGVAFYEKALSAEEAAQVYQEAKQEADFIENPLVLEKFTFEGDLKGEKGTTIDGIATNKNTDPQVVVDPTRGYVLKMSAGTASKSASGKLSTNPFAGKDINGAAISYWVKHPVDAKLKTVVPSVSVSFVGAPEAMEYDKMSASAYGEMSSSVLCAQTDFEAFFYEGYTGQAYKTLGNSFKFSTKKNKHIDDEKGADGKILDAFYDEDAVAKQKEYEERVQSLSEWHMETIVFTNAGIKMYIDGEPLSNNPAEPDDKYYRPEFAGPRFFDGYYKMQYDGYAPFYKATDNQGARTLMALLTGTGTNAYIGMMYKDGTDNVFLRTYETYYDDITYYGNNLTDEQVKQIYKDAIDPKEQPSIPPVTTTETPQESDSPQGTDAPQIATGNGVDIVTDGSVDVVSGDATGPVTTDDGSVLASKNAYTGKTGDGADLTIPLVGMVASIAALVVVTKKRKSEDS